MYVCQQLKFWFFVRSCSPYHLASHRRPILLLLFLSILDATTSKTYFRIADYTGGAILFIDETKKAIRYQSIVLRFAVVSGFTVPHCYSGTTNILWYEEQQQHAFITYLKIPWSSLGGWVHDQKGIASIITPNLLAFCALVEHGIDWRGRRSIWGENNSGTSWLRL
jgi:hypothetical protein